MLYERRALGVLYVCEGVSFVNAGALKYIYISICVAHAERLAFRYLVYAEEII